jgi:uncharacterized LabA/DUF88 family protein
MPIAVVIDGAYFLRRFKSRYPSLDPAKPEDVTFGIVWLAAAHLALRLNSELPKMVIENGRVTSVDMKWIESPELYRIFFYDCPPLAKRTQLPISKKALDLSQTDVAKARLAIHERLLDVRKVALRLGRLNDKLGWRPKPEAVEKWLSERGKFNPTDEDFEIDTVQKGVDMRLGLDVASLAFKRQVDQIVLVAADADFVPATKLARREGIDVVLDPMGGTPAKDLIAHVDGIRQADRAIPE